MDKRLSTVLVILVMVVSHNATAEAPVTISSQGWTITANPREGMLTISQKTLGTVLQDVRINLQGEDESDHGLLPITDWSVEQNNQSLLTIHTSHPIGAWTLEIDHDTVKISSTFIRGILTAKTSAPLNRLPVRTLDPAGFPVDWAGTNEAMINFGGNETRSQSFLPRKNSEVMYFALGLVSGTNFHALFDRKVDTVIQFSEETTLRRADQDENLLDVRMPVPGNSYIRLLPDYYTKILGAPFYAPLDDTYFNAAPMVWSSWTGYYGDVTENDIVQNTDWLAKNLKPFGFQIVQLDDGYDRGKNGEHYWIENWDKSKFPHGPQWLTSYIKSKGMRAGLWLVPNSYAGALDKHPEWYVRSNEGDFVPDYLTPVLDSSNPEVLNFLKKLFTTLGGWGFEYYKFDGEGSIPQTMPELNRQRLYDPSLDPVLAYRDRMKVIRDTIGPHVFLEGCPAGMPLNGIGYFNSYFNGHDLYNNFQGMYPLFSSINANAFFNHIFAYVMPGEGVELGRRMTLEEAKGKRIPALLREISTRENPSTGVGVTDAEARTLVSFISLTGVAYPVGNVMPDLPQERLKLLQETMPTMPILPLDLFSRGTKARDTEFRYMQPDFYVHNYPEILDLKVSAKPEIYDVVGFTNWRSETTIRKIPLVDKLGLDSSAKYIAFDFWDQKLLGVFANELELKIEPHDTRVLMIHPALNRPQLIGNSRHITGTYSILEQEWDEAKSTLSGTSESVPGQAYTLWFYIPKGIKVLKLRVAAKESREIPARQIVDGDSLMISFEGQLEPVRWEIGFSKTVIK
ncbi:MAG TPA: alpha-galactosidase [Terriglobales bacterium]|nr:alpha-galactosidase [Terriglobales bacterium]